MAIGRGTIYQRNGQWTINFTVNGKRVRQKIGPSKRMAEMVLKKHMAAALEGKFFAKRDFGKMSFQEFANSYLEKEIPHLKSARSERLRVLSWIRHFGSRPIGQITRSEIEEIQRQSRTKRRPATVNKNLARLRRLFTVAVNWGLLEESPMKNFRMLPENNRRHRYLSVPESERLVQACISPRVRAVVEVLLHTGMRLGEALNLRWKDIDFSTGLLLIPDSKNGHPRHIPMDAVVVEVLTNYPHHPTSDLVFANVNGGKVKGIREGFKNACERAGLTDLHVHDLRHTFASQWMMAGGDLFFLKEVLGHRSIVMTQRYSHLSPQFTRSAVNLLNKIYGNSAAPAQNGSETAQNQPPVTPASQAQPNA
jgi:integrase